VADLDGLDDVEDVAAVHAGIATGDLAEVVELGFEVL
jgi:hypothetical protein